MKTFVNTSKKAFFILIALLLMAIAVSSATAGEKPLLFRDMLYSISDPSKASSTEILSFLEEHRKVKVGQVLKVKKDAKFYTGMHDWGTSVLLSLGFPENSILRGDEGDFNRQEKEELIKRYHGAKFSAGPYWTPLLEKNGSLLGFRLYPNHFFRSNAHLPEWAKRSDDILMWLEPGILVLQQFVGNPEILYLNASHPIVEKMLNLPCEAVFEKMQFSMKGRTAEIYSRFESAREAVEFIESSKGLIEEDCENFLLPVEEAVVNLGIILRLADSGGSGLNKNDRFWGEPILAQTQSLMKRLIPLAETVFNARRQKALAMADADMTALLDYASRQYWPDSSEIGQVSPEEIKTWSSNIRIVREKFAQFQNTIRENSSLNDLEAGLSCLKEAIGAFNTVQSQRLYVSREVSDAVKSMGMGKTFYNGDDWRVLGKVISEGLRSEEKKLSERVVKLRDEIKKAREKEIVERLKQNSGAYIKEPLLYVKSARLFFEGYYSKDLPVVGDAFKDGGASGDSSLRKVKWQIPPEEEQYEYRVYEDLGFVHVHAFVEGNAELPGLDGGAMRMQKFRLHLVRVLALENGENPVGDPSPEMSRSDAELSDLGNRVFIAEMWLNRQLVSKEDRESAIRNLLFEVYDN